MKIRFFCYLFGLFSLLSAKSYCQEKFTLIGKVIQSANPCREDPCLPGLIYAIRTDSIDYLITINSIWQCADIPLVIKSSTYFINDSIKAIGTISKKQDINFHIYNEIEIDTSFYLTNPIKWDKEDRNISIFPNPSQGTIFINSQKNNIETIEIFNINGELLFSSKYLNSYFLSIGNIKEKGMIIIRIELKSRELLTEKIYLK